MTFNDNLQQDILLYTLKNKYCKGVSSRLSRLVAHLRIFRLFMKGKFNAYVLWPLAKRVQNWIVDRSTAHNFTVCYFINDFSLLFRRWCKARAVCPAQHDSIFLDHVLKKRYNPSWQRHLQVRGGNREKEMKKNI